MLLINLPITTFCVHKPTFGQNTLSASLATVLRSLGSLHTLIYTLSWHVHAFVCVFFRALVKCFAVSNKFSLSNFLLLKKVINSKTLNVKLQKVSSSWLVFSSHQREKTLLIRMQNSCFQVNKSVSDWQFTWICRKNMADPSLENDLSLTQVTA